MLEKIGSGVSTLQIADGTMNGGAPFENSSDCCQILRKRNSDDSDHFSVFGPHCCWIAKADFLSWFDLAPLIGSSIRFWVLTVQSSIV